MFFNLLFVFSKMIAANNAIETWSWLECTGKDSAKAGQPQSKKLMGSRRKSISKGGKSSHAQTGSGQEPDDDTERRQQGEIVDSGSAAGTGWEISGEEDLISSAQCHKEKNILAQDQPQGETCGEQDDAFHFAESECGLAAVENPHGNQVQQIQYCAGTRQRRP